MHGEAAELADRVADAVQEPGVLFDGEAGAVVPASVLIAQQAQDDVAGRPCLGFGRLQERREHHGYPALHVESAASPDIAVRPRLR